jgi:hypothetical protein
MDPGRTKSHNKGEWRCKRTPSWFLPRRLLQFRMLSAHCFDVYLMDWDRSFMHEACSQKDMFRDGMNNSIMMYDQQENHHS